jgi:hypothetical protein
MGQLGTKLAVSSNRRSVLWLIVATNVVPSLPSVVTAMMEAISTSETVVLTRVTRRDTQGDGILHSHDRENLHSYTTLTGWALLRRRNVCVGC